MKRILFSIACLLIVAVGFNACAAKELNDCLRGEDCEYYEPPEEGGTEIERDSILIAEISNSENKQ